MPTSCKRIGTLLNQYIDGELNPAKRMLVARHVKACTRCAAVLDELSLAKAALRAMQSRVEAPAFLKEALAGMTASRAPGPRRRRWFLTPEFSWGLATVSILTILVGYLVFLKPEVSACNLITAIQADSGRQASVSEVSSILAYFGRNEGDMIRTVGLTIQNYNCKGEDALILHMTVRKDKELLVYSHGNPADIEPRDSAGVRLKRVDIERKDFYVGDFAGMKVVCWKMAGRPYAVVLSEA